MSWYDTALAAWYNSKIQSANAMAQGIGQLGKGIAGGIGQAQQNNTANQVSQSLANSGVYAPRAGLVSAATNPYTGQANTIPQGVSTMGTAPAPNPGGGAQGLQMRLALQQMQNQQQNQGINQAIQRARLGIEQQNANTNEQSRVDLQQQRLQQQAQAQLQRATSQNADTMERLQKDVNAAYPGAFEQFSQSFAGSQGGPTLYRGAVVNGKWIGSPNNDGPMITADPGAGATNAPPDAGSLTGIMPYGAFQGYLQRYQNIMSSPTGRYIPPPAQGGTRGAPPVSNAGNPRPQNLPTFMNPRQVPPGYSGPFYDNQGNIRQRGAVPTVP